MYFQLSNLTLRLGLVPLVSLSLLGLTTLPLQATNNNQTDSNFETGKIGQVLAELSPEEKNLPEKNVNNSTSQDSSSNLSSETALIPEKSAIIVSFPSEISLDPNRKDNFPISLPLVHPILDSDGNVVIPEKSLVSAQIKRMKGGDVIEVTSLVVGGRIIPIHATGLMLPVQQKPEDYTNQTIPSPGVINNTLTNLSNYQLSSTVLNQTTNNLNTYIGLGLALFSGLTAPTPKKMPARVSIPQGTVYILAFASSVEIPRKLIEIENKSNNPPKVNTNTTPLKDDD